MEQENIQSPSQVATKPNLKNRRTEQRAVQAAERKEAEEAAVPAAPGLPPPGLQWPWKPSTPPLNPLRRLL